MKDRGNSPPLRNDVLGPQCPYLPVSEIGPPPSNISSLNRSETCIFHVLHLAARHRQLCHHHSATVSWARNVLSGRDLLARFCKMTPSQMLSFALQLLENLCLLMYAPSISPKKNCRKHGNIQKCLKITLILFLDILPFLFRERYF